MTLPDCQHCQAAVAVCEINDKPLCITCFEKSTGLDFVEFASAAKEQLEKERDEA